MARGKTTSKRAQNTVGLRKFVAFCANKQVILGILVGFSTFVLAFQQIAGLAQQHYLNC